MSDAPRMTMGMALLSTPHCYPEEHRPPAGLKTFYVRLMSVDYSSAEAESHSRYQRQCALAHLSDDELAWLIRSALSERDGRNERRQIPLLEVS